MRHRKSRCVWGAAENTRSNKTSSSGHETVKVIGDGGGSLAVTHNVYLGGSSSKLEAE